MLDKNQIELIIPHRSPFLFIDKIKEIIPGKKSVAIKEVIANDVLLKGHYPANQVMPGVIIIEALIQTATVAIFANINGRDKYAYLMNVSKSIFRKKVLPGSLLELRAEIIKDKYPVIIASGVALVNNEVVAETEFGLYIDY